MNQNEPIGQNELVPNNEQQSNEIIIPDEFVTGEIYRPHGSRDYTIAWIRPGAQKVGNRPGGDLKNLFRIIPVIKEGDIQKYLNEEFGLPETYHPEHEVSITVDHLDFTFPYPEIRQVRYEKNAQWAKSYEHVPVISCNGQEIFQWIDEHGILRKDHKPCERLNGGSCGCKPHVYLKIDSTQIKNAVRKACGLVGITTLLSKSFSGADRIDRCLREIYRNHGTLSGVPLRLVRIHEGTVYNDKDGKVCFGNSYPFIILDLSRGETKPVEYDTSDLDDEITPADTYVTYGDDIPF
jgi:hypothetical protein